MGSYIVQTGTRCMSPPMHVPVTGGGAVSVPEADALGAVGMPEAHALGAVGMPEADALGAVRVPLPLGWA